MAQYRGFAFPFRKGKTSFPAAASDNDLIHDSITQIMLTQKRERVMRPVFGADIFRFVFANNNDFLKDLIATETRTALGSFEPRIIVQDITSQQNDNSIITTITYIVKSTGQTQSVDIEQASPR